MDKKALWVSIEFFEKVRSQDGRNDEERIKEWASEPDGTGAEMDEEAVLEVVRNEIKRQELRSESEIKDIVEEEIIENAINR